MTVILQEEVQQQFDNGDQFLDLTDDRKEFAQFRPELFMGWRGLKDTKAAVGGSLQHKHPHVHAQVRSLSQPHGYKPCIAVWPVATLNTKHELVMVSTQTWYGTVQCKAQGQ